MASDPKKRGGGSFVCIRNSRDESEVYLVHKLHSVEPADRD